MWQGGDEAENYKIEEYVLSAIVGWVISVRRWIVFQIVMLNFGGNEIEVIGDFKGSPEMLASGE